MATPKNLDAAITTVAARCPNCKKYHQIASIGGYDADAGCRREYGKLLAKGYDVIRVTTQDAKDNFACSVEGCPGYVRPKRKQPNLFAS